MQGTEAFKKNQYQGYENSFAALGKGIQRAMAIIARVNRDDGLAF
jgi:hypothetical protein